MLEESVTKQYHGISRRKNNKKHKKINEGWRHLVYICPTEVEEFCLPYWLRIIINANSGTLIFTMNHVRIVWPHLYLILLQFTDFLFFRQSSENFGIRWLHINVPKSMFPVRTYFIMELQTTFCKHKYKEIRAHQPILL